MFKCNSGCSITYCYSSWRSAKTTKINLVVFDSYCNACVVAGAEMERNDYFLYSSPLKFLHPAVICILRFHFSIFYMLWREKKREISRTELCEAQRELGAYLSIKLGKLDSNGNSLAGKSRDFSVGRGKTTNWYSSRLNRTKIRSQESLFFSGSNGNRDFKIRRRDGNENVNRFNKQNNNFARASLFFIHLLCTTTTWRCLI